MSIKVFNQTCDKNMIYITGLTGLEPATSAVTGRCSNQLNYNPYNIEYEIKFRINIKDI